MNSSGGARTATPAIKPSSRGSPDAHTFSRQSSSYHERSTPNGALTAQRRLPPRPDGCHRLPDGKRSPSASFQASTAFHLSIIFTPASAPRFAWHRRYLNWISRSRATGDVSAAIQPTMCKQRSIAGLISTAGRLIRRRFCLRLMLSEVVDEYTDAGESDPDGRRLYLFLHPDSAAFVVAGPTLELMAQEHPRLPATFYHLFTGPLTGG